MVKQKTNKIFVKKLSSFFVLTSNSNVTACLIFSGFSKLFNPAGVLARVVGLGLTDDQGALALIVTDQVPAKVVIAQ